MESAPRGFKKDKSIFKKIKDLIKDFFSFYFSRTTNLKSFCKNKNISYKFFIDNEDESYHWVKNKRPDLIVVFGMSRLLKKRFISAPKHGAINLHPSLLPKYKGPNPDFWHYYFMEKTHGITVHFLDESEDTGEIICQKSIDLDFGTKSPERLDTLITKLGGNALIDSIDQIAEGKVNKIEQPATNDDNFRARNLNLCEHSTIIDWKEWETKRIWHLLRGTETWLNWHDSLRCAYANHRYEIKGYVLDKFLGEPGDVVDINNKKYVLTKDGAIELNLKFSPRIFIKTLVSGILNETS